ncbi:MAG: DUF3267 domain-containing protein [Solobacterium sp.]|nr:DUF3267 domain-containing protein [Solobacterium sp.]
MFNIVFKGNYVSDDQLIKRDSIPKEAIEFGIIPNLQGEFGRGFLILMPVLGVMVATTYLKVKDLDYHLTMGLDVIVSFVLMIVSVYLLTFVHEIIHALFYPADAIKEIWKSKEQGAYFVYCEKEISKERFIIMCLAPMFILGIIPFMIWLILPNYIPMPYNLAVSITFWLMTIVAMGDVANVYHVIKEVPKGAKVFNYGLLRSFYIKQ